MAYVKNTWVNQEGQVRYTETEDDGYKIFTANYEQVTEIGTPVNADNMNHIEQGIADCFDAIDNKINAMLQLLYPIGSIYVSTNNINPLEALFGTWELVAEGRVLQGADSNHAAGTTIAAGLPNVTGRLTGGDNEAMWDNATSSGAFTMEKQWKNYNTQSDSKGDGLVAVNFNASNSNSIYGNSSTVQPPAYVVNIWRRTA